MTSPRSPTFSTSLRRIAWAIPTTSRLRKPSSPGTQDQRRAPARRGPRTPECDGWQSSAIRYVREEPQLERTLDRDRELALVPTAASGDASRADLALLAHGPAQRSEVLVVDDVDLVLAERAL